MGAFVTTQEADATDPSSLEYEGVSYVYAQRMQLTHIDTSEKRGTLNSIRVLFLRIWNENSSHTFREGT